MQIALNNPFIDSDQSVKFDTLFWGNEVHTLLGLCKKLGWLFSQNPPMWKKQKSQTLQPQPSRVNSRIQPNNQYTSYPNVSGNQSMGYSDSNGSIDHMSQGQQMGMQNSYPSNNYQNYNHIGPQNGLNSASSMSQSKYQNQAQLQSSEKNAALMDRELRDQLISNLAFRYEEADKKQRQKIQAEMLKYIEMQEELQSVARNLQQQVNAVQGQINDVDQKGMLMQKQVDRMKDFKSKFASQIQQLDSVKFNLTVDQLIVPGDLMMELALKHKASELGIEETMSDLQKMANHGKIDPENYMSRVRELSRRQFMSRFIQIKISQSQKQTNLQRGQTGVNLAIGDPFASELSGSFRQRQVQR